MYRQYLTIYDMYSNDVFGCLKPISYVPTPEFLRGILILPIIGSTPSGFRGTLEQVLGLPMALLHWSVWIDLFLKVNLSEGVISNRVHFVVCYLDIMCDYVGSYR